MAQADEGLWSPDTFFGRNADGWFWYEVLPPPPVVPPPQELAPNVVQAVPAVIQPVGPAVGSRKWLTDRMEFFKEKALDNPTEQNVRAFYYAQKAALDRATRFTEVSQRVVQADPYLDENATHPTSNSAANYEEGVARAKMAAAIKEISKTAGLLFVFRSDCEYCEQQLPVLKVLEKSYGITIRAVSADGRPMPGNPYPSFSYNPELLTKLGTDVTPSLYLMHPPSDIAPVSFGIVALDDLEKRILVAAVSAGWITEKEFGETRQYHPVANLEQGLSTADEKPKDPDDPEQFVEFMKKAVRQ